MRGQSPFLSAWALLVAAAAEKLLLKNAEHSWILRGQVSDGGGAEFSGDDRCRTL